MLVQAAPPIASSHNTIYPSPTPTSCTGGNRGTPHRRTTACDLLLSVAAAFTLGYTITIPTTNHNITRPLQGEHI